MKDLLRFLALASLACLFGSASRAQQDWAGTSTVNYSVPSSQYYNFNVSYDGLCGEYVELYFQADIQKTVSYPIRAGRTYSLKFKNVYGVTLNAPSNVPTHFFAHQDATGGYTQHIYLNWYTCNTNSTVPPAWAAAYIAAYGIHTLEVTETTDILADKDLNGDGKTDRYVAANLLDGTQILSNGDKKGYLRIPSNFGTISQDSLMVSVHDRFVTLKELADMLGKNVSDILNTQIVSGRLDITVKQVAVGVINAAIQQWALTQLGTEGTKSISIGYAAGADYIPLYKSHYDGDRRAYVAILDWYGAGIGGGSIRLTPNANAKSKVKIFLSPDKNARPLDLNSVADLTVPMDSPLAIRAFYLQGTQLSNNIDDVEIDFAFIPEGGVSINAPTTISTVADIELATDFDRNGVVNDDDLASVVEKEVFHFWINDDDDRDAVDGIDIPQQAALADMQNSVVDGMRDVEDLFPVYINFNGIVNVAAGQNAQIRLTGLSLKYADPVKTGWIAKDKTGLFLRDVAKAGAIKGAPTFAVGESSPLSSAFLSDIRSNGGSGALLAEGIGATAAGQAYAELSAEARVTMPNGTIRTFRGKPLRVKLSGVEEMYRHINLIGSGRAEGQIGPADRLTTPGWPTAGTAKEYVYAHGYNINDQQARGEHATVFKRLYQLGLKSRFTGITWYGWQSQVKVIGTEKTYKCPDYYENVINAFKTSKALRDRLVSLNLPSFAIGAHSLGNMLVSSAMADHGLNPAQYFLFDAAVATEAYQAGTVTNTTRARMSPSDWVNDPSHVDAGNLSYATRLWASEWHKLFTDNRRLLNWRNRFGAFPQAYNFYSSTENVLKNADGAGISMIWDAVSLWSGTHAWYAQEVGKGRSLSIPTADSYAGWGFSLSYTFPPLVPLPPSFVNATSESTLQQVPFFGGFQYSDSTFAQPYLSSFTFNGADLYGLDGQAAISSWASNSSAFYITRAKLLAEGIPAVSYATGANPVPGFGANRNFDMSELYRTDDQWPSERDDEWLHGDIHQVAAVYLHSLYTNILSKGGLN